MTPVLLAGPRCCIFGHFIKKQMIGRKVGTESKVKLRPAAHGTLTHPVSGPPARMVKSGIDLTRELPFPHPDI